MNELESSEHAGMSEAPDAPESPAAAVCIALGTACTIAESKALRTRLLEHLAGPGPIEIDGGEVSQVDAAGLQVLVAFALDCLEGNRAYAWRAKSQALSDAIALVGIGSLVESPGVASFGSGSTPS